MVSVYTCDSYKNFLQQKINSFPAKGRGVISKIGKYLNLNPSYISQVIRGSKHLSLEQALKISDFFSLKVHEREFFLNLLQYERAGTSELKDYFKKILDNLNSESQKISRRVVQNKQLDKFEQSVFYSNWYYSAVRLSLGISKLKTPQEIASSLNIPLAKVNDILDFLLSCGLCEEEEGKYISRVRGTHLPADSPYISSHHRNWRVKAMENFSNLKKDELAFSAPMTLSKSDFNRLKQELLSAIENASNIVKDSPSEELACLNIDLFLIN